MSRLSKLKMYLGGPKRHSVETISAIVSKRGRTPAGKLVATFVDGRLTTAIVDSRRVENDTAVINELTEFYAMSARMRAELQSFDSAKMALDKCARQVKARVKVWPSARASQMVAKCRKAHGVVRKGKKGASLKRWTAEKWKDVRTHKPCGSVKGGSRSTYCRPTKKVSRKTPVMHPSKGKVAANYANKRKGKRAKTV